MHEVEALHSTRAICWCTSGNMECTGTPPRTGIIPKPLALTIEYCVMQKCWVVVRGRGKSFNMRDISHASLRWVTQLRCCAGELAAVIVSLCWKPSRWHAPLTNFCTPAVHCGLRQEPRSLPLQTKFSRKPNFSEMIFLPAGGSSCTPLLRDVFREVSVWLHVRASWPPPWRRLVGGRGDPTGHRRA